MTISVVMPAYNSEKHLFEAIESVIQQTHSDFELIVVNDGSQDRTGMIIDEFALRDKRIKPIHQENHGTAGALNRGLAEATADWVMIMHADDIMLPNRIERQIAFITENPDVKVSSCLAYYISEHGRQLAKTSGDLFTREKFDWYLKNNETIGMLHPGVIFNRAVVLQAHGYRQAFWPAEDLDLWNRLAEQGHLILVQNEVLMKYRIHTGSASTSRFMLTRQKYDWGRACMMARRQSRPEPDWERFQQDWQSTPLLKRLNRDRKIHAKAYYHEAGHDCLRGDYLHGLPKLVAATILQPGYVLPRLKDQVLNRR